MAKKKRKEELLDFLDGKEEMMADALVKLKKLVESYQTIDKEIIEKEKDLKERKEVFRKISQEEIPELLLSHGLSEIKIDTGEKIKVSEGLSVTIMDNLKFFDFLKKRNEDDIIKHTFNFGQLEDEKLVGLHEWLLENDYDYEDDTEVHSQTRKKYFKETLGIGAEDKDLEKGIKSGKYIRRKAVEGFAKIFLFHSTKIK